MLLQDYKKKWWEYGLCPECKEDIPEDHLTGLVEIYFEAGNGAIRDSSDHGTATREYQFHYKKCPKCGYWEMYEYRETPTWLDDLVHINPDFKQGNIIHKWIADSGHNDYLGYKVTRW